MADANSPLSIEPQGLSDEEYDTILAEAEIYFEACLQIRTKDEGLQPLQLNTTQRIVHEEAEKQLAEEGRVRLMVLKGRQVGVSTYIGGRGYRKVTTNEGQLAYIVTHEDQATQNLFGMAKRFHEHCLPEFKPNASTNNANELAFAEMDSSYKIATAGARTAGRSSTIQFLHASEFDFWPDATADEVFTGLMEAVAKGEGTEVFIESTANVPGGRFHRAWKAAKRGESSFRALFIPWFLHAEYRVKPPAGWEPPEAFKEYGLRHDLDIEQIRWAWETNRDAGMTFGLSPDEFCPKFKREYPSTDEEAFETAGDDLARVFPLDWIRKAQARWIANRSLPLKPMTGLGVDVAQGGQAKTSLAPLHGVRFEPIRTIPGKLTPDGAAVAGQVVAIAKGDVTIAIDMTGGWGGDAYSHLKALNLPVLGVVNSQGSTAKTRDKKLEFVLIRDQLFWEFREALHPELGDSVELPPGDDLEMQMLAATFEVTRQGIKIRPKDEMMAEVGTSTDELDAVLLAWFAGDKHNRALAGAAVSRLKANGQQPNVNRQYAKVVGRKN
jgi:hypothetical protein